VVILTNSMKGNTYPLCMYIMNQFIKEDLRDWSDDFLNQKSSGTNSVQSRIDELKSARIKKSKPSVKLTAYAGKYYSGVHGNVMITQEGDNLKLTFEDAPNLGATLTHWHNNTWQINWDETHAWFDFGLVTFAVDNTFKVKGMNIEVPNYDIFFDEVDLVRVE
jgi:hypothetical protein